MDKSFARRLYQDLRSSGISCWFDEKQLLPGDLILEEIDKGIRLGDKVILVCSKNSLDSSTGWWVREEVERALAKERDISRKTGRTVSVLVPVMIDDHLLTGDHPLRDTIMRRHVGDSRQWRSAPSYALSLSALVAALNADRNRLSA